MKETLEEVKSELDNFMMWYWIKWILLLIFKLAIDIPFIIIGPIMAILQWRGLVHNNPIEGIFIACVFCLFIIPDLFATIRAPWKGGGRDLPVYMEDCVTAKETREDRGRYLTIWRHM
jgi:hypothetical protein